MSDYLIYLWAADMLMGAGLGIYWLWTDEEFAAQVEFKGVFDPLAFLVLYALIGVPTFLIEYLFDEDRSEPPDDGDEETEEGLNAEV